MGLFGPSSPDPNVEQSAKFDGAFAQSMSTWATSQISEGAQIGQEIMKQWDGVMSSGAVPYGYSPELDHLLVANVMASGAKATANTLNAMALRQQQASGGANVLPQGSMAALETIATQMGQGQIAEQLGQEKIAGYEQGLSNLTEGTKAETGVMQNATSAGTEAARTALGASQAQEQAGAEIFKEATEGSLGSQLMKGAQLAGQVINDISGISHIAGQFQSANSGGGDASGAAADVGAAAGGGAANTLAGAEVMPDFGFSGGK